ncbi:hypothetical protein J6590_012657 [Homalodisca vitripennis]|nr:hypothetical protein J6590_012657 [Homalodisca vitripennis]
MGGKILTNNSHAKERWTKENFEVKARKDNLEVKPRQANYALTPHIPIRDKPYLNTSLTNKGSTMENLEVKARKSKYSPRSTLLITFYPVMARFDPTSVNFISNPDQESHHALDCCRSRRKVTLLQR